MTVFAVVNSNLLLPVGVPLQRQRAMYAVTIYCGEDLPRTDLGIVATVQKAITGKDVAFIDACVKVSFAGHVVSSRSVLRTENSYVRLDSRRRVVFGCVCNFVCL